MPISTPNRSPDSVRHKFSHPDQYLRNNFEIANRAGILRAMLPGVRGLTIFDIGCGDGSLSLQFLPEARQVTLVDLSQSMLVRAQERIPAALSGKVALLNAGLMEFQPPEPADIVICVGVLAHVEALEPAIRKLADLTKPGGRCVLQITDCDRVAGRIQCAMTRSDYPLLRTGRSELEKTAAAAGFKLRQRANHYLVLPGMGRLPKRWLRAYDQFVLNSRTLSRVAPSTIVLFER
jgi:ubiquinone/menaquinone biosynthesis C-methylase UbiE